MKCCFPFVKIEGSTTNLPKCPAQCDVDALHFTVKRLT